MAQVNERVPRRFSLTPTVAVRVRNGLREVGLTHHLPSALLQKYTNLLNEQGNTNEPQLVHTVRVDVNAVPVAFSTFVDWLYGGMEALRVYHLPGSILLNMQLWALACELEAEELKNQMVEHVQSLLFDDDFISILTSFESYGLGSSALVDYMCAKVAYEIVDKGWAHFIQVAANSWEHLMRQPSYCAVLMKRLTKQLRLAYFCRKQGGLVDPTTQLTCKWHKHTKKSMLDCPRHQPKPLIKVEETED